MTTTESLASLISRCLRAVGASRAFAAPGHGLDALEGFPVIDVATEAVAIALADADGRLSCAPHVRPGLALLPGRRLRLSSQPGAVTDPLSVALEDLPAAIAGWSLGRVHAAFEIDLDIDLGADAPAGAQPLVVQRSDQLLRFSPSLGEFTTMVIVGSGVVRDGAAGDVVDFVARIGARVMSTFGAIGVVPLHYRQWCGVVGVQADDPHLGGLDECDLVIAIGVDDDELGESLPLDAQVLEVEPWQLPFLATDLPTPEIATRHPALVDACVAVFGDHRDDTSTPLHPVRALLDVVDVAGSDVQVFVDPGAAGFWFARGLAPTGPGRVVVPALNAEGFAVAAAVVCALDGGRSIAVTTPGGAVDADLLDLASSLDLGIVVEQWGDDVVPCDPSRHRADLVAALADSGIAVTGIAVDLSAAAELVELAGPVVAWSSPGDRSR